MKATTMAATFAVCLLLPVVHANDPAAEPATDNDGGQPAVRVDLQPAELVAAFRARYMKEQPVEPAQYHADGAVSRDVGTLQRQYSVARVGADGEVEVACLSADAAVNFLEQATSPGAGEVE